MDGWQLALPAVVAAAAVVVVVVVVAAAAAAAALALALALAAAGEKRSLNEKRTEFEGGKERVNELFARVCPACVRACVRGGARAHREARLRPHLDVCVHFRVFRSRNYGRNSTLFGGGNL